MNWQPYEGASVMTPRGAGIVYERLGIPTGNGAKVLLTENPTAEGEAAVIFNVDELTEGPALPAFEVGQAVTVPGGYPGAVVRIEGDTIVCAYQLPRPRVAKQGRFPFWRLVVSNAIGR